jgi:hypothetical protein
MQRNEQDNLEMTVYAVTIEDKETEKTTDWLEAMGLLADAWGRHGQFPRNDEILREAEAMHESINVLCCPDDFSSLEVKEATEHLLTMHEEFTMREEQVASLNWNSFPVPVRMTTETVEVAKEQEWDMVRESMVAMVHMAAGLTQGAGEQQLPEETARLAWEVARNLDSKTRKGEISRSECGEYAAIAGEVLGSDPQQGNGLSPESRAASIVFDARQEQERKAGEGGGIKP